MTAYPILTFIQSFDKFKNMDPEIQMKMENLNCQKKAFEESDRWSV